MAIEDILVKSKPKPTWIRAKLPTRRQYRTVQQLLEQQSLHTVCEEAFCPNITECWESGTATFLLMGDVCTRGCRFCDITAGNPRKWLDREEPRKVAEVINNLSLKYVVLTSVDRDDLEDGGAAHLAQCINTLRELNPDILVEILIPDFKGNLASLRTIVEAKPDVIGHNIETTEELTPKVRDKRASYKQSLFVLKSIKDMNPHILTKSSIMLGLGENMTQVHAALQDLRKNKVDIVTFGQYLQPSRRHLPVVEYVTPQMFKQWEQIASQMEFLYVVSGPLVRSSYKAGEFYIERYLRGREHPPNNT
ncbi:MAG: lipoyl synthase [Candidatus Heimdallarchaeota archaeon]